MSGEELSAARRLLRSMGREELSARAVTSFQELLFALVKKCRGSQVLRMASMEKAMSLMNVHRYEDAIAELHLVLAQEPEYALAHYQIALAYSAMRIVRLRAKGRMSVSMIFFRPSMPVKFWFL